MEARIHRVIFRAESEDLADDTTLVRPRKAIGAVRTIMGGYERQANAENGIVLIGWLLKAK